MLPLTLLAPKKLSDLLNAGNALQEAITTMATSCNVPVPVITTTQVVFSSASPDLGDKNIQLTYPRICLYTGGLKNVQFEKFRSLSGSLAVTAEIWASANLVEEVDQWIHFYVEAVTGILRESIGDWGDGLFFTGVYDIQFQPPKVGGIGYVELAKVTCNLSVSRN
jgi:hypothetical protein